MKVTFREAYSVNPQSIQGTLMECDELFICIDQGNDKLDWFVPLTAIHHIEPVQDTSRINTVTERQ